MKKLRVGDAFRVFEVVKPLWDATEFKNKTGIEINCNKRTCEHKLSIAVFYFLTKEIKQVGTIRIKSLKK